MAWGRLNRRAALIVAVGLFGCAPEAPRINAPFVPTPMETVAQMLRMAAPGPSDVLYDLGSGDGRIPIFAVQRYDVKKAVGIDIDPELVRESRENARAAGMSDRITFVQGDVFEMDFSEATVVTVYLLQHLNLELRPRLLQMLRPGTRVVSYEFHFGDWRPDGMLPEDSRPLRQFVESDEDPPRIYYWVVPARVAGEWRSLDGARHTVRLTQSHQDVTGTLYVDSERRELIPIRAAQLVGDRLRFEAPEGAPGHERVARFDVRIAGDVMQGTVTRGGRSEPFLARRAS